MGPLIDCDVQIPLQATISCRLRVCSLIPRSHFCLFISINYWRKLPILPKFLTWLHTFWLCFCLCFDFVSSPLPFFFLSPQTWHKQIELELFNHFSELPTQRGAQSPPKIYLNWCYMSIFHKCNRRVCCRVCLWSWCIFHTLPVLFFFHQSGRVLSKSVCSWTLTATPTCLATHKHEYLHEYRNIS